MKNKNLLLFLGLFCNTSAMMINRFFPSSNLKDFLCGFMVGLGITFLIDHIIRFSKERRSQQEG